MCYSFKMSEIKFGLIGNYISRVQTVDGLVEHFNQCKAFLRSYCDADPWFLLWRNLIFRQSEICVWLQRTLGDPEKVPTYEN